MALPVVNVNSAIAAACRLAVVDLIGASFVSAAGKVIWHPRP